MSGISVRVRKNESIDGALRRFRKVVEKSGILEEVSEREEFRAKSHREKGRQVARKNKKQKKPSLQKRVFEH